MGRGIIYLPTDFLDEDRRICLVQRKIDLLFREL
jgi:hypothetical protein